MREHRLAVVPEQSAAHAATADRDRTGAGRGCQNADMLNEIIECKSNEIQFILYQLPDEEGKIQVVIKDETILATQKAMAQLYDIDKSGISRHIANIFKEDELQQETTVAKIATVVNRGIRGEVEEEVDVSKMEIATRNRRVQTLNPHAADRFRLRQRSERSVGRKEVARA